MEFEKQILDFLANHNDGEYRSAPILFADFIKAHVEYIDYQRQINEALNRCFELGYIKNRERPSYFIYLTELGRAELLEA